MEKRYDVFISCKSDDYVKAEPVYHWLVEKGHRPFFAPISLRISTIQGEPVVFGDEIDDALEQADNMVLFTTKAEHVSKGYVKDEWRTFVEEQRAGRKSGSLVTILDGVNVADLPIRLRSVQSFTLTNYKAGILRFLGNPYESKGGIEKAIEEAVKERKAKEAAERERKAEEDRRKTEEEAERARLEKERIEREQTERKAKESAERERQEREQKTKQASSIINGHEYVDLGLPSGTLWATCNIGASKPENYGDYFAWGEIRPKSTYDWSTYKYANGADAKPTKLTKYCDKSAYGNNGFTDNLTTLQSGDDPATAQWGGGWQMPSKAQWEELLSNTTSNWTTKNDVKGRLFTSKTNRRTVFLPAAGSYRWGDELCDDYHNYWSSSLFTDAPHYAFVFGLEVVNYVSGISNRCNGYPVRPVRSARQN